MKKENAYIFSREVKAQRDLSDCLKVPCRGPLGQGQDLTSPFLLFHCIPVQLPSRSRFRPCITESWRGCRVVRINTSICVIVTNINSYHELGAVRVPCIFICRISFDSWEFQWWPESLNEALLCGRRGRKRDDVSCLHFLILT